MIGRTKQSLFTMLILALVMLFAAAPVSLARTEAIIHPALQDDTKIAFTKMEDDDEPAIYVMNADGTGEVRFAANGGYPLWSGTEVRRQAQPAQFSTLELRRYRHASVWDTYTSDVSKHRDGTEVAASWVLAEGLQLPGEVVYTIELPGEGGLLKVEFKSTGPISSERADWGVPIAILLRSPTPDDGIGARRLVPGGEVNLYYFVDERMAKEQRRLYLVIDKAASNPDYIYSPPAAAFFPMGGEATGGTLLLAPGISFGTESDELFDACWRAGNTFGWLIEHTAELRRYSPRCFSYRQGDDYYYRGDTQVILERSASVMNNVLSSSQEPYIILGHSLGGAVAATWAGVRAENELKIPERNWAITLDSPLRGIDSNVPVFGRPSKEAATDIPWYYYGGAATDDLKMGNAEQMLLREQGIRNMNFATVGNKADLAVVPRSALPEYVPAARRLEVDEECPQGGHHCVLSSQSVSVFITNILRYGVGYIPGLIPETITGLPSTEPGETTRLPEGVTPEVALPPAMVTALSTPTVDRIMQSVVQVVVDDGTGSGVKIAAGVITNEHVVRGARSIELRMHDGRRITATVIKSDARRDLALLQTEAELPALQLAPAREQAVTDTVRIFGYPVGIEGVSVTLGIVSAFRDQGLECIFPPGVLHVQTDAAINRGNSGGAMVNSQGQLIGLPASGWPDTEGLSFAVAAEEIEAFLADPVVPTPTPIELRSGQPVAGVIRCAGDSASYFFEAEAGQRATITMDRTAGDLDPFLTVYGVDGELLEEDDDSGQELNSRIQFSVPVPGRYLLSAQSLEGTGGYALTLTLGQEEPPLAIQSGQTVAGTISSSGGSDRYFFEAEAGQRATITMDRTAGDLDPFLTVYGIGGYTLAEDDDCGEDLNSRIQV
ncbi:MAG: hypothetical protein CMJ87_04465, partial [Planctomycetes bacterium]|nr:hypothetical protein [Planctomycetota bacterium]